MSLPELRILEIFGSVHTCVCVGVGVGRCGCGWVFVVSCFRSEFDAVTHPVNQPNESVGHVISLVHLPD